MPKFIEVLTEDWLKTTEAAKRYKWWQENIEWLEKEPDGLAALAFDCQLDLGFIDKATPAQLMDAIADFHFKQAA